MHEAQMHTRNCFITLTYDQEHIPDDGGLRIGDFQRFCKRLRKRMGPFRFFHCGEYGSQNGRPHYHALLFGLDFGDDRVQVAAKPYPRFRSPTLESVWGMGLSDIGSCTYESAAYVARYVHKGAPFIADVSDGSLRVVGPARVEVLDDEGRVIDRVNPRTGECLPREYATMSRNPGLGTRWLETFHGDVYPSDEVVHNGRVFPVPRFYDAKVASFTSEPGSPAFSDLVDEAKAVRRRKAELAKADSTGERLSVRERCAVARLRLRQRK